jgi:hypothetical protein
MNELRAIVMAFVLLLVAGLLAGELKAPSLTAICAECGTGPKDKKCPEGQKCSDGKCVKK